MYYVYHVLLNNNVVLDYIIEYNDWENIEEDWNKKGLGVIMISSNE